MTSLFNDEFLRFKIYFNRRNLQQTRLPIKTPYVPFFHSCTVLWTEFPHLVWNRKKRGFPLGFTQIFALTFWGCSHMWEWDTGPPFQNGGSRVLKESELAPPHTHTHHRVGERQPSRKVIRGSGNKLHHICGRKASEAPTIWRETLIHPRWGEPHEKKETKKRGGMNTT